MASRKHFGIAISTLIFLALILPTPHADAFTSNQNPVIRIGEWKSPSYGVLTPWGGLAFDPAGNLWVADSENNRVLGFIPPFSSNMSASFVIGQPNFLSTAAAVGADRLKFPLNVAFDHAGNLWVVDTDNSRLLEFDAPFQSGMNASVVIGQWNFSTAFFNTTRNGLSGPEQVAFDSSGNLWVADGGNGRVLEFQPPFSTGMNASLVIGEPDFTHRYCPPSTLGYDATCSNHSLLTGPGGIAFDLQGDLWITESYAVNGRLVEFKPPFKNGMQTSLVMQPVYASAIKFDSGGNLWLGCPSCYGGGGGGVVEYRPPFSEHSIVWENGNALNTSLTLGKSWADVPLSNVLVLPVGLTFDSAGNLWVVDARSSWLIGLLGRVVGYDAQVHPLDTFEGRVFFENNRGLLVPLSSISASHVGSMRFPQGLFNFTIQGLPSHGSVAVTVSFPQALPSGIGWWSNMSGRWSELPAAQAQVNGNNVTLTLTNASENGVISEFGGPAFPPTNKTSSTETSVTSSTVSVQPQSSPGGLLLGGVLALIIVVAVIALYWKRLPVRLRFRTVAFGLNYK